MREGDADLGGGRGAACCGEGLGGVYDEAGEVAGSCRRRRGWRGGGGAGESCVGGVALCGLIVERGNVVGADERIGGEGGSKVSREGLFWSQILYAALLLGGRGCVQVRFPVTRRPPWCIWDHAGSQWIYTVSGAGIITDPSGRLMDVGRGRDLVGNWGLIAADASVHGRILELSRAGAVSGTAVAIGC
jgi:hypothetical protein